jgi:hypothetical protein
MQAEPRFIFHRLESVAENSVGQIGMGEILLHFESGKSIYAWHMPGIV